ncbi:serine/threonine-protein kinase [Marinitenerispora sediminis]|uniref:Serine/threonine protein kinase n=3 Tax=Marinitenerispora sediminis TaxID=1931232 RepID=A0A368SZ74_9ACTN|nr:serine/threonine-protein kinase [Marinitenerispora sediminis]RCV48986.1 serine/threonine protein kinase [Marinitenerispora sediminis]RCV50341.1 serine/threonine protein kinase [Marinitenerispora sediminis]
MSRRSERTISVLVPPDLTPLAPEDPRTVGRYALVGRVGSGQTGAVYAAVDPEAAADRVLVVKTLRPARVPDEATRGRLDQRLRVLATVDGRCYVPPVEFDAFADPAWLAMPYVGGIPLAQFVRRRGPLAQGRLVALAAAVAEGLAALHGKGLAHGDLKPGNIVLASSGPRLLDCALPGDESTRRFAAGWLAPERHRGEPPRAVGDVFAWGAVTAFAATGRLPFGMGEPEAVAARVLEDEPDIAGVPPELAPLVRRALAKEPDDRPTGRELLSGVLAAWEAVASAPAPGGAGSAPGTAVTRLLSREWPGISEPAWLPRVIHLDGPGESRRGRGVLVATGAVLAAVLVGGGVWAATGGLPGGPAAEPQATPSREPSPEAGGSAAPEAAPSPAAPRTAVVRFGAVPQPDPVDGPWVYTEVAPAGGASPDLSGPVTPDQWSTRWNDVSEAGQPERARIAPDAEVLCAQFCLTPGESAGDAEGRGSHPVTGQDFINYLSWGGVVIAEVTFAEEPAADGVPEIVRITELFPPAG